MLRERLPQTAAECLAILTDPHVRMGITVQHMVLSAARGLVEVRLPDAQSGQRVQS